MKQSSILILSLGCVATATAQDALRPVESRSLEPLTVTGGEAEVFRSVGAAAYITEEEIRDAGHLNLNQILAKVPGVYTRDEDGFGQFPNISMRGVDGTRSEKVTVMEDGILTAPSPYSAPAAYYSPKVARMAGIELMKGSSQVRFGPQTTGGVINFLSTGIPDEQRFYSRSTYGTNNTFFNHTWYGDTVETANGRFGYLLELHSQNSDGFRNVDFSSRDTGFELFEPMIKLFWEPNTALKQRIEMKVGYTDFDSNESYTGMTEADLQANPDRRYAATQFDQFTSEQWRTYLKWIAEPTSDLRFESAVYYNQFNREWDKIDQVAGTALHQALLDPARVAILNGTAVGQFRTTNNLRDHEGYGWQNQANLRFETGRLEHDLAVGLRLHYDRVDAQAQRTLYDGNGAGAFTPTPGPLTNNGINEAFATAVYVEDSIRSGNLTIRPGVRFEQLSLDHTNPAGTSFSGDEELFTAGVGASYEFTPQSVLFGGIYRGVASPSPQAYLVNGVENEESIGYEVGYRHQRDSLRAEVAAFYTDFEQLISTDAGFGFTNTNQNAGTAEVLGLEMLVQYDAAETLGTTLGLPVYASATWTRAQFTGGNLVGGGGGGVYAGARDGNEIPYVPEWRLATGIGVTGENWGVNLDMYYTASTWGTGYNGDPRPGTQTIRDGEIPALLLFDLTANYQLNENITLLAGVHNLFDERELVSRIPEGPRANAPRMIFAGFEANF